MGRQENVPAQLLGEISIGFAVTLIMLFVCALIAIWAGVKISR